PPLGHPRQGTHRDDPRGDRGGDRPARSRGLPHLRARRDPPPQGRRARGAGRGRRRPPPGARRRNGRPLHQADRIADVTLRSFENMTTAQAAAVTALRRRASDDDWAFCDDTLPKVSRTFALSIAALPQTLRAPIGVAYLLCRIVDT